MIEIDTIVLDDETLGLINSTVPIDERQDAIRMAKVAVLAERRANDRKAAKVTETKTTSS